MGKLLLQKRFTQHMNKRPFFLSALLLATLLTFCSRPELPAEPEQPEPSGQTTPGETPDDGPVDSGEVPGETPVDPETPDDKPVKVSEITILPADEISLEIGKTVRLSAEIAPEDAADKSIIWSADPTSVATVSDDGLVTAVAEGEANIIVKSNDGGAQAVKTVSVFKPQPQAFSTVSIVRTDALEQHAVSGTYRFSPGQKFTFQAKGIPEDAPDEIEFVCSTGSFPAFYLTPTGEFEAIAGNSGGEGYIYARSKKNPLVKSSVLHITVTGPYARRAVLCETGNNDFMPSFYPANANRLRHTKYIGRGAKQMFLIKVEIKDSDGNLAYLGPVKFDIVASEGTVKFSTVSNGSYPYLVAQTELYTHPSTLSNTEKSTVTIKIGTYTRTVDFIVSELDPYRPKIGDGLYYQGNRFLDGGYRGYGIFEENNYESMPCNAMIAWIGNVHLTEDPLCANYCHGGIIDADGNVVHGIAIPVKTGYLYRATHIDGEIYSDKAEDITRSDALPSWFSTEQLRWDTYFKMTAFSNTAALVYRNGRNGTSHDVKPINFFVSSGILKPSSDESKKVTVSSFSWESDFYGNYEDGNIKNRSGDGFSASPSYTGNLQNEMFTPWLMPSLSDLFYIFYDSRPYISTLVNAVQSGSYSVKITDKVNIFRTCGKRISGSSSAPGYVHSYWTCQQKEDRLAPMFTITLDGNTYSATVSEKDKTHNQAYVLPIAYF